MDKEQIDQNLQTIKSWFTAGKKKLTAIPARFNNWLSAAFPARSYNSLQKSACWLYTVIYCILLLPGKFLLRQARSLIRNIPSSWQTSKPEYPMYIVALLCGAFLGLLYYRYFGINDPRYVTGFLTVIAAPFILIMWKWRNTHKLTEFAIQHRNANEALLVKAGEQLGNNNEAVRISGIEAVDRYARLMLDSQDKPDFPEFQRAVNLLCAFARQRCATHRKEAEIHNPLSTPDNAYGTSGEVRPTVTTKDTTMHDTDYELCITKIFKLMHDYYNLLISCCEKGGRPPFFYIISDILTLPLVDLNHCNLTDFRFSDQKFFLICAALSSADLTRADLTGADLTLATLTGAHLTGANLTEADLTQANLTRANLNDADLTDADLTDADLTGATLYGADLTDADLTDADLTGATLSKSTRISAYQFQTAKDITGLHSLWKTANKE